MNNKPEATIHLPLLEKLPKPELEALIKEYITYSGKVKYVYYFIFGFFAIIVVYNLVFAGKSYPIGEYNTIRDTMVGVVLVFLLIFISYGGYVIAQLMKVKNAINKTAEKNRLDKKALRKEFHLFVKDTIGGTGIK